MNDTGWRCDTAFGDLDAMGAVLRSEVQGPNYDGIADGALSLAKALRDGPTRADLEDASTLIEYLVGLLDAHRRPGLVL